jgi:hypothetical protein
MRTLAEEGARSLGELDLNPHSSPAGIAGWSIMGLLNIFGCAWIPYSSLESVEQGDVVVMRSRRRHKYFELVVESDPNQVVFIMTQVRHELMSSISFYHLFTTFF